MRLGLAKKTLLLSVVFLTTAGFIIMLLIVPTVKKIRSTDQQLQEMRANLERRYQKTLSVRTSLKQGEKIREEVTSFKNNLLKQGEELVLITALEDIATREQIEQKIISSNLDEEKTKRIALSIRATGDYKNVMQYFAKLEQLPYFIFITKVHLTTEQSGRNQSQNFNVVNLDISLYVATY